MKRTAAALMLLAGLSGCMTPEKKPAGNEFGKVTKGRERPALVEPGTNLVGPEADRGEVGGGFGVLREGRAGDQRIGLAELGRHGLGRKGQDGQQLPQGL